jgi:hypothetical protein
MVFISSGKVLIIELVCSLMDKSKISSGNFSCFSSGKKKRGLVGLIVIVLIVLVGGFYIFWQLSKPTIITENENASCVKDSGCVKIQTSCCPCESGGAEECGTRQEAEQYQKNLENCPKNVICAQIYNCKIKNCTCYNGNCSSILN